MAALTRGRYLAREELLNVGTPWFIVCYDDVRWNLCWRCETGGMSPDIPSLVSPLQVLFFQIFRCLSLWLDAILKNFCIRHWMGPRKCSSNRVPRLIRPALARNPLQILATLPVSIATVRPVTSLGHQGWRIVYWEGPKFFKLQYVQHIFPERAKNFAKIFCFPLVTGLVTVERSFSTLRHLKVCKQPWKVIFLLTWLLYQCI